MASATTALMTVEEFRRLQDPPGVRLELHNGEVVKVGSPNYQHWKIQKRLAALFEGVFGTKGEAGTEFAFRPRPEYEVRVADVAWISQERAKTIDALDNLKGSPEIVGEVLSPSNTVSEMVQKRQLCFAAGCEEFWIVDPDGKFVEVFRANGTVAVYNRGERIPLGGAMVAVNEIF